MNSSDIRWTLRTATKVLSRVVFPQISRVGFSVTRDCNQRCKTCNIWEMNKLHLGWKEAEMKLEEIQDFCKKTNYPIWWSIGGGEPTIKEDIGDFLIAIVSTDNLEIINLTTNGQRPKFLETQVSRVLESTSKYFKIEVSISIEGTEELHNSITRKLDSFSKASESYERLKVLSGKDSRVVPKWQYTISEFNEGHLAETFNYLEGRYSIGVPDFIVGTALDVSYFTNDSRNCFMISDEGLKRELEYFLSRFSFGDRLSLFGMTNYACLKKMLTKRYPKYVGLQYSVLIDPQWIVYPTTFQCPDYPVGSLREYNFDLGRLLANSDGYKSGGTHLWTQCDSYPALIFKPWRLLF